MWIKDEKLDNEDMGAGDTAIAYTDDFVDAAIAKLDAAFGKGYAKNNPAAMAGYLGACASNLGAFMTAASSLDNDMISDALDAMGDMDEGDLMTKFETFGRSRGDN